VIHSTGAGTSVPAPATRCGSGAQVGRDLRLWRRQARSAEPEEQDAWSGVLSEEDVMTKMTALAGITLVGAAGYGLACLLAWATQFATELEDDEYCRPPAEDPAGAAGTRSP